MGCNSPEFRLPFHLGLHHGTRLVRLHPNCAPVHTRFALMGGGQSKRAKGSETKHGAAQQPDQQQLEEHSAQNTQKETKSTDAASLGVAGGGEEGASALYGHVFVINGDLKCITCDAWVLPTNKTFGLEGWEAVDLPLNKPSKPKDWGLGLGDGGGERRVARWEGWDRSKPNCPWILLCSVEADEAQAVRDKVDAKWYVSAVETFLDEVAADLHGPPEAKTSANPWGYKPAMGRAKPLVLVPLVGTGEGGFGGCPGKVIRPLIELLLSAVQKHGLDVALVTRDRAKFAACQAMRRQMCASHADDGASVWAGLPEELKQQAARLADLAVQYKLALFMGAGASAAAGLPLWMDLLRELSEDLSMSESERAELLCTQTDPMDAATVIEKRYLAEGKGDKFRHAVAGLLACKKYPLMHALVAALPCKCLVTTNYDTMAEQASAAIGVKVAVLPHKPAHLGGRWILKLHGCVSEPKTIVLSRQDYMRFNDRRAALSSIVQALLITRHMVFLGFSLRDDNFHRIIDMVRKEVSKAGIDAHDKKYGTQLSLKASGLSQQLWSEDLNIVDMTSAYGGGGGGASTGQLARTLEIFMDYTVSKSRHSVMHMLDQRYINVLSPAEARLHALLQVFVKGVPDECVLLPVMRMISEALDNFGSRELSERILAAERCELKQRESIERDERVGHMFVVLGEYERLRCDAVLVPIDTANPQQSVKDYHTRRQGLGVDSGRQTESERSGAATASQSAEAAAAAPIVGGGGNPGGEDLVMPDDATRSVRWARQGHGGGWATSLRVLQGEEAGEVGEAVEYNKASLAAFVDGVERDEGGVVLKGRLRKLLVVQMVGGMRLWEGESGLLEYCSVLAEDKGVDIVLSAASETDFAATQVWRRKHKERLWRSLSPRLQEEANTIAALCLKRKVAVFMGGGVGRMSCVPAWKSALMEVASELEGGGFSADELQELSGMGEKDVARLLASRLQSAGMDGNEELSRRMADKVDFRGVYGLANSLLAALPVREYITTNVDAMLERASQAGTRGGGSFGEVGVFPENCEKRYVVKLNGCAARKKMVITQEDELRDGQDQALQQGIIQSILITRHVLFLGFNFNDVRMHAILDGVRRAQEATVSSSGSSSVGGVEDGKEGKGGTGGSKFGTQLSRTPNSLMHAFWKDDVGVVNMTVGGAGEGDATAVGSRLLEIFLDYLVVESRGFTSYFLNPRYKHMLSREETLVFELFQRLLEGVSHDKEVLGLPAWKRVRKLIERLGGGGA